MSFDKANPVDEIYAKYPDGATSYESIRKDLADLNTRISNNMTKVAGSVFYDSYAKVDSTKNSFVGKPGILNRVYYYGIVLEVKGYNNRNIYIDVPPFNNKTLVHIDNIAKDGVNLEDYEDMIFFPSANSTLCNPVIGGIAKVMLPDNYPRHINSNNEDAIYVEMYAEQKIIQTDRTAPAFTNLPFQIPASVVYGGAGGDGSTTEYSAGEFTGEPASIFTKDEVKRILKECKPESPRLDKLLTRKSDGVSWARGIFETSFISPHIDSTMLGHINSAAAFFGIDPDLVLAFCSVETLLGIAGKEISGPGAMGHFQIMPIAQADANQITRPYVDLLEREYIRLYKDKTYKGEPIIVLKTLVLSKTKKITQYIINPKFVIRGEVSAVDLREPIFWPLSALYSARSAKVSMDTTAKAGFPNDYFLIGAGYNGDANSTPIKWVKRHNYGDINKWDVKKTNKENTEYMLKFWYVYNLIKCGRALFKK